MVKLDWLRIHRFRWVTAGSELKFRPGINAIIGRNGTGKTTLLELLGAVWAGDFSAYAEEEFDVEFRFVGEGSSVELRVENRRKTPAEAKGHGEVFLWKFTSKVEWKHAEEVRSFQGTFTSQSDGTVANVYQHMSNGAVLNASQSGPHETMMRFANPTRPSGALYSSLVVIALSPFLEHHVSPNGGHWSSSDSAPTVPGLSLRGPRRYPEGIEGLDRFVEEARFFGLYGDAYRNGWANLSGPGLPSAVRQVLQEIIQQSRPPKHAITFSASDHPEMSPLAEALSILEFKDIEMRFDLELGDPRPEGEQPFTYGNLKLSFTKHDGAFFGREKLSHGQKRIFGFLWYLACSPQVAIADELSNGLHYSMAEAALAAIGERQAFLAIQDPMLLDSMTFDSVEDVTRAFVCCSTLEEKGRERWKWSSLTEDQARTFFDAYEVNVQHVHRILRTWGLW